LAAVGLDGKGGKHPLGVIEGAAENATVAQALLDNLIERGLDPTVCRLFVIDGVILQAWLTLPSCFASSNKPTLARMTF
jgi:hypothetical protein